MTYELASVAQCAELCGLGSEEIVLGVAPSAMHASLYQSYLLHSREGSEAVRDMIVADIRAALDLGDKKRAADLLIVLRRLLSERRGAGPEAKTGEVVPMRSRPAPRAVEPRRTRSQASVVERLCATRRESTRPRGAAAADNVLSLDVARIRRFVAGLG